MLIGTSLSPGSAQFPTEISTLGPSRMVGTSKAARDHLLRRTLPSTRMNRYFGGGIFPMTASKILAAKAWCTAHNQSPRPLQPNGYRY